MIDTKSSIRLAPSTLSAQPKSSIEDNAPMALVDTAVRTRAYELYQLGGRVDGRAEQDWYQAESDLRVGEQQDSVSTNVQTKANKPMRQSSAT